MKYKLINKTTGEEHICDKMVVDGWDYYVSDEGVVNPCYFYNKPTNYLGKALRREGNFWVCENIEGFHLLSEAKKVIATNNPNIDIPKLVDEVELLANEQFEHLGEATVAKGKIKGYVIGYNKSQETHPYSDDDMIEFLDFSKSTNQEKSIYEARCLLSGKHIESKELLQLWKEQRTKTLYYET